MSQRTQVERVVRAARSYRGVCAVDFLGPDTVDGGAPITRLAARLWDAEQQGYLFECIGRRSRCKVWRLIGEPGVDDGRGGDSAPGSSLLSSPAADRSTSAAVVNTGALFEVEPERPLSPYEYEDAA
jgi:hypothetical protein